MGRGEQAHGQAAVQIGGRRRFASLVGGSGAVKVRSLKREFDPDRENWKQREREFISGVVADLERAAREFATTDEGWRQYLRLYAETPRYSALNNHWARAQLAAKGAPSDGLILSETHWKALGRRVKAEYARPEARRDRRYGYDREREWDDRYAAEMMAPIGMVTAKRKVVDANGNPVLDENGEPVLETYSFWPNGERNYKAFVVYHEDATEDINGGPPKPLPERPWAEARGSEEDAAQLLEDLGTRFFALKGIEVEAREIGTAENEPAARLEEGKRLIVDSSRPKTEQAVAALGIACQQAGGRIRPGKGENLDGARKRARAAAESAKYVIASLYGLDSKEQAFPEVAEIAEQGRLSALTGDIHRRVGELMARLDPLTGILEAAQKASREGRAKRAKRSRARQSQRAKRLFGAPAAA